MKIKILQLTLLLALVSTSAFAKVVTINWEGLTPTVFGTDSVQLLSFTNADYGTYGALPVYHFQEALEGNISTEYDFEVVISNPVYETLDLKSTDFVDFDSIPESISSMVYKTIANKKANIDAYILPVIRNESSVKGLTQFDVSIKKTPKLVAKSISNNTALKSTTESVLASGKWVKLSVTEQGLHRLTYNDIVGMGLDPSTVRIYGTGRYQEDPKFINRQHDDLVENALYFVNGSDGKFGSGDYVYY